MEEKGRLQIGIKNQDEELLDANNITREELTKNLETLQAHPYKIQFQSWDIG